MFIVGGLVWGLFVVFFVTWFCLLAVGIVVLREIWQPARILPPPPSRAPAIEVPKAPMPADRAMPAEEPLPRAVIAFRCFLAVVGIAACVAFAEGTPETKAAIAMAGTLVGMYAFFRGFLR